MSEPTLLIEKRDRVATFTLNRPTALNALSRELRAALVVAFDALQDDAETGVVILTGRGRAFTAGLDLKELGDTGFGAGATEAAVADGDVIQAMARCAQPIIGAINGFAIYARTVSLGRRVIRHESPRISSMPNREICRRTLARRDASDLQAE